MTVPQPIHATNVVADAQAALTTAATLAGHAPSIHNTQPWRWRLTADTLDLFLDRSRLLDITDPDGRLAVLSCGAALHHAGISFAAQGWHATIARLPDPADRDHLAGLHLDGSVPVDPQATHLVRTILVRHADRRPVTGAPVTPADLADLTAVAEAQGTSLHVLRPDQLADLAAAAEYAQRTEVAEAGWQEELAYWTGGIRPDGPGIPDAVIPDEPPQTPVPGRDFGHQGSMPVSAEHDRSAVFAMLYGRSDDTSGWLCAGEALSAVWLTAIGRGSTVLPISAPIEVGATREVLRRIVSGLGYPYLVLRLGIIDAHLPEPPHTPRLAADQIIERTPNRT
jgi:hypothetical protein